MSGGDAPWSRLDPAAPEPPQPGAAAPDPPGRRAALSLMAAGTALAAAGCDGGGPEEFGHPLYARPRGSAPEDATYATTLDLDGLGRGVLVRTRAGHAVKVEGNPAHPASLGATDVFAEASVLSLHDPARSRRVVEDGRARIPAALDAALGAMRADALGRGGEGLRLLTGPVSSPTSLRLIGEALEAFPGAAWHVHDPMADPAAEAGARAAFGGPVAVLPDLSRARAALCLSADPLGEGPAQLRLARDWIAGRAAAREAGRAPPLLLAAGATPGLTSARADRRFPLGPAELDAFARAVAAALGVPGLQAAAEHPEAAAVAAALRAAAPDAAVLAGRGASAATHALAHAMNHALGAAGGAVRHAPPALGSPPPGRGGDLAALVAEMEAGRVSHLLHLGGCNPAYDAPAALGFAEAVARVPASVHLGQNFDETAALCRLHAPLPHPLEAWGDSRAFDGTPSLRQATTPKLVPEARGEAEALSALLGRPSAARDAVLATWRAAWGEGGPRFEGRWAAALEEGVAGAAPAVSAPPLRPDWDAAGPARAPSPDGTGLSAVFAPDPHLREGAFATNPWLQEMPRPLTKATWGNAVLLAPATAARLGLAPGDEVEVSLGGDVAATPSGPARPGLPEDVRPRLLGGERMARRRPGAAPATAPPGPLRAPVWPAPGHAPGAATLLLGGGRRAGGEVAEGRGYDAYRLRPADGAWTAEGLVLRPTGRRGQLVTTDSHHGLDPADAARVVAPGGALPPIEERPFSLHPDWPYPGGARAWGMAIDLDACIGCNACAVACQAENNVPVVGPAEVARGREMHWLRVERHHHGTADAPAGTFQPVPCMHCEKAPCEPVCPVNATLHDHEGLNVMVHARCIGTRTCSNNCPYKVRRFNWADHRRALATPARNPEVPLRPRGVMEKCTYCSHRIAEVRQRAAVEGGAGGTMETACQRACPTRAIAFGDLNDPGSAVSRARRDGRSYALLAELGTRPRTSYLARVARPAAGGAAG